MTWSWLVENEFYFFIGNCVEGTNVLAAEVHQDRPTSSDIYLDMEFNTSVNKETLEEPIVPEKYMI